MRSLSSPRVHHDLNRNGSCVFSSSRTKRSTHSVYRLGLAASQVRLKRKFNRISGRVRSWEAEDMMCILFLKIPSQPLFV